MQLNLLKEKLKLKSFFNMLNDGENIMVILSSPSGAGKTTISKKSEQKYQSFKISISHTTRAPRSMKSTVWTIILFLMKSSSN